MKTYLISCLFLGLLALGAAARADDGDMPLIKAPLDPDIDSPTYDGSTYNTGQLKSPTAAEIQAAREVREQEDNWLIRGYEEQVKLKSAANGQADLLDPYARIASDKDLARLAGIPAAASPDAMEISSLRTPTDPLKNGPTLRIDPSQLVAQPKFPPMAAGNGFKPLITPLSATEAAGLHDFYSSLPAGAPPPVLANTDTTAPAPAPAPPANDGTTLTDMPGLAAAQSQITQGKLSYDITFKPLPDDFHNNPPAVGNDETDNAPPQPPSGDVAKQVHRADYVATTGKTTPPPVPVKVVIPPDPELIPKPIPVPIIMAGHPQIPDPFDILR